MSFCQLVIQLREDVSEICAADKGCRRLVQVRSHHLDVADRSEHGAQPLKLVAKTLRLRTSEQRSERRQAAAQSTGCHAHPVDGVRAVDAGARLTRPQLVDLRRQVCDEQLTSAPDASRGALAHVLNLCAGDTRGGRVWASWASRHECGESNQTLALGYRPVASWDVTGR